MTNWIRQRCRLSRGNPLSPRPLVYSTVLPDALAFAHRALAIAANFARTAGLILRRFFRPSLDGPDAVFPWAACTRAQRALCAAAIRARAAADIVRFPLRALTGAATAAAPELPARLSSSASKASIFSLIAATFRNCDELKS